MTPSDRQWVEAQLMVATYRAMGLLDELDREIGFVREQWIDDEIWARLPRIPRSRT